MGPLANERQLQTVVGYVDRAVGDGARVVAGAGHSASDGLFVRPTILTDVRPDMEIATEEIFGPVLAVMPFDSEEEAVTLANDTDYGLAAAVWTSNLERAHRVAQQMRVGMAWVNTWYLRDLRSPFGGMGLSGIGREGGMHSFHFYTQPTNVCIKL